MRRVASMRKAVDKDYRAIDPEDGCDLTILARARIDKLSLPDGGNR